MSTNVTLPSEEPERGNKSQGWLQSDKDAHTSMWKLGMKAPTALAVLHFMISKLKRGANGVAISAPALARQLGIAERTARTAVNTLSEAKFVQILKSGNTNVYIVNSKVAWQGTRGMRYASFNAQIIVDEQEQVRPLDELIKESDELKEVPIMEMEIDLDAIEAERTVHDEPQPGKAKGAKKIVRRAPEQPDLLGGE